MEVLHEDNVLISMVHGQVMLLSIEDEPVFVHDTCIHNSFSCFVFRAAPNYTHIIDLQLATHPFCDLTTAGARRHFRR